MKLYFFQNVFIPGLVALKLHKMVKTSKVYSISNSEIDNFIVNCAIQFAKHV